MPSLSSPRFPPIKYMFFNDFHFGQLPVLAPIRTHIVGMVVSSAFREVQRVSIHHIICDLDGEAPSFHITYGIWFAIAVPTELALIDARRWSPACDATLLDHTAIGVWEARIFDSVASYKRDRDLTFLGLSSGFMIYVLSQTFEGFEIDLIER